MTASAPPGPAERLAWLRLARSEGIGPLTFAGLLRQFGSAEAALAALPAVSRRRGRSVRIATADEARTELDRVEARGCRLLTWQDSEYPPALRATTGSPPVLCLAGSPAILQRPMVAVVGARNASGSGLLFTQRLAIGLGGAGFVVVSGLARGIDAQAHKAALTTGTVAVLAGGHDNVYPSDHAPLADRIVAEGGAVVSEMPPGWEPRGRDFPRRNRIVAGLSLGTVVVEAAHRSGSLITARLANEQGREVFAVPGSPLDPRAEGTNDLLRQGATFCTSASDVIEALDPLRRAGHDTAPRPSFRFADGGDTDDLHRLFDDDVDAAPSDRLPVTVESGERTVVLSLLGPVPVPLDDLARLSGLGAGVLRSLLIDLELAGAIAWTADGSVVRT